MSKADQQAQKQAVKQNISSTQAQSGQISGQLNDILGGAKETSSSILPTVTGGYGDILSSGGYDPSITGTINNTYTNFANTGGISDADAVAMRNRAQRAAQGTYEDAGKIAERQQAATGGYGSSGAILGDLARKGSQAAERASTDTNADIAKLRQTGMLSGAAGLSDTQNRQAQNRLAAAGGLSNVYGLNLNEVNNTVDNILRNFQTSGQLTAQDQQILTNLANQPGVFDKIIGTIGVLAGAGAGVAGAFQHPAQTGGGGGRSDIRVKKNIEVIGRINNIPIVFYEFKDMPGLRLGTIAQDVEKIYPDLVYEVDGIKHVKYPELAQRLRK